MSLQVEKRHGCILLDEEHLHELPLNLERTNALFDGVDISLPEATQDLATHPDESHCSTSHEPMLAFLPRRDVEVPVCDQPVEPDDHI